jgi:hypothetical protein
MRGYAVDTVWDDPFEHQDERRRANRFSYKFKLSIAADDPERSRRVVGPGIVRNISLSGVLLVTKHNLTPEQRVFLEVPTVGCADSMCLPHVFEGTAQVIRVADLDGGKHNVAMRFGEDLFQNMEFAIYIDTLQTVSRVIAPAQKIA